VVGGGKAPSIETYNFNTDESVENMSELPIPRWCVLHSDRVAADVRWRMISERAASRRCN
jgi:hypothetical protein